MARLKAIETSTASDRVKALLDLVRKKLGIIPNMTRTMALSPAVLEGYLGFSGALAGGALPPRVREQIALAVGEANRCEYCVSAHTAGGRHIGLGEEELVASREGLSSDPKVAAALRFATRLVERRGAVTDVDVAHVREAGWSDAEVAEIIAHVALNIFTNYFNSATATDIDFPRIALRPVQC